MPKHALRGTSLYYEAAGEGVPVCLLHGFPLDGRVWGGVASDLTASWRTVIPDLRGFGRSFDPADADRPFSIDDLADDVHVLLGGLGVLPCVVVGLSMGGYVALALAERHRADLLALALVDTKAAADTPEARQKRQAMIDLVDRGGSSAVAGAMFPEMVADVAGPMSPRLESIMVECPTATIRRSLVAMRDRPDRTALLPTLDLPAAVVVGEHDRITPPDAARSMSDALPDATLTVVGGAGHMSPLERPQEVADALRSLVMRVDPSVNP